tara:strand:+ start:341 stop:766 length:426 start_codon:yes stop_codon:yes gene_type:complete
MGRPMKLTESVEGTTKVGAIGLDTQGGQQLRFIARVTGGTANNTSVIKQKGTNRFTCTTSDGTSVCQLVAAASGAIAIGQATLTATDSSSKTYYVTKLTGNHATLTQFGAGTHEFATGAKAKWLDGTGTAVEGVSVTLVSN